MHSVERRCEAQQLRSQADRTQLCLRHARGLYQQSLARLVDHQGGCSVTILVTSSEQDVIVQYRPLRFAVDVAVVQQAVQTYGDVVPKVLGAQQWQTGSDRLQVVCMTFVEGVPWSKLARQTSHEKDGPCCSLVRLLSNLAGVLARAWRVHGSTIALDGRIGKSIKARLQMLSQSLPSASLRRVASHCLDQLESGRLEGLPVVLTHGDLLPSNILVDEDSGRLTGLVDWAEAELLPFGMCLYAVDHLVGSLERAADGSCSFVYFDGSIDFRYCFWLELRRCIPALDDPQVLASVQMARTIGVLLWLGIAWDDGSIDRAVNAKDDPEELARLQAFLADELKETDLPKL